MNLEINFFKKYFLLFLIVFSIFSFIFSQEICSEEYQPVCGEDQITYFNECIMKYAGVELLKKGSCNKNEDILLKPDVKLLEIDEEDSSTNSIKKSDLNVKLKGSTKVVNFNKDFDCSTLGEDKCESSSNSCKSVYSKKWIFFNDEFLMCDNIYKNSNIEVFTEQDLECPTVINYVCGEDKITYPNSCYAENKGIAVIYQNKCEDIKCGEFDEKSCTNYNLFCTANYNYQFYFFGQKTYLGCEYN